MSENYRVGLDIVDFRNNGKEKPVTRVTLNIDGTNVVTAGTDAGMELTADCPYATQAMADSILAELASYSYQAYSVGSVNIDPAAELGDSVTVNHVYSVIGRITDHGDGYPDLSAPGEAELEEEYPSAGPMTQEFDRKIAETRSTITKTAEEIILAVENELDGLSSSFTVALDEITAQVEGAEGNIAQLQLTTQGLTSQVESAEGNISSLQQTAAGLSIQISNTQGSVSSLSQTVNSMTLSVSNSGTSSTISLLRDGIAVSSQSITFAGVVTFQDLAGNGTTTINGSNITSGTITGTTLVSREYSDMPAWLTSRRTVAIQEGAVTFGYDTGTNPAAVGTIYGRIYTDYSNNRFYIGTPGGVVLKLYSGGNMSIDAANGYTVYIGTEIGTVQEVRIGNESSVVRLNGTVYVNGSMIS